MNLQQLSALLTTRLKDPLLTVTVTNHNTITDTYEMSVNGHPGVGVEYNNTFHAVLYNGSSYSIPLPSDAPTIPPTIITTARARYSSGWDVDTIVLYSPSTTELSTVTLPKPFSQYNKGIRTMKLKALTSGTDLLVVNLTAILQ